MPHIPLAGTHGPCPCSLSLREKDSARTALTALEGATIDVAAALASPSILRCPGLLLIWVTRKLRRRLLVRTAAHVARPSCHRTHCRPTKPDEATALSQAVGRCNQQSTGAFSRVELPGLSQTPTHRRQPLKHSRMRVMQRLGRAMLCRSRRPWERSATPTRHGRTVFSLLGAQIVPAPGKLY